MSIQYDNTPTVVAVLVRVGPGLLFVRRNNEPGRGLIGLPGGYHMRGETWQEAGAREVLEETGHEVRPENFELLSMETDEYGNNLVIADGGQSKGIGGPIDPEEVQSLILTTSCLHIDQWAFPRHYEAARRFFNGP